MYILTTYTDIPDYKVCYGCDFLFFLHIKIRKYKQEIIPIELHWCESDLKYKLPPV